MGVIFLWNFLNWGHLLFPNSGADNCSLAILCGKYLKTIMRLLVLLFRYKNDCRLGSSSSCVSHTGIFIWKYFLIINLLMIPKTSDKPICVQAMFSNNAKPQLFWLSCTFLSVPLILDSNLTTSPYFYDETIVLV